MKCEACKKQIQDNFLGKIMGAYFKDNGKLKAVCRECQRLKSKGSLAATEYNSPS